MVDMWAVGYDFRLVPFGDYTNYSTYNDPDNHFGKFFLRVKEIVEATHNGTGKKVFLLGHSMGGFVGTIFLNVARYLSQKGDIPSDWVDNHIAGYIPVAPSFDGGP